MIIMLLLYQDRKIKKKISSIRMKRRIGKEKEGWEEAVILLLLRLITLTYHKGNKLSSIKV